MPAACERTSARCSSSRRSTGIDDVRERPESGRHAVGGLRPRAQLRDHGGAGLHRGPRLRRERDVGALPRHREDVSRRQSGAGQLNHANDNIPPVRVMLPGHGQRRRIDARDHARRAHPHTRRGGADRARQGGGANRRRGARAQRGGRAPGPPAARSRRPDVRRHDRGRDAALRAVGEGGLGRLPVAPAPQPRRWRRRAADRRGGPGGDGGAGEPDRRRRRGHRRPAARRAARRPFAPGSPRSRASSDRSAPAT